MSAVVRKYAKDKFARRGEELYCRLILPQLSNDDTGRFVALDIESGEYEIDDDQVEASLRLRRRLPESQTWLQRIG
jgi:hypothetical protein